MSKQIFQNCTVKREIWVKHFSWNIATGDKELVSEGWEVKECNVPLFGKEKETGICQSCHKGNEFPSNMFASNEERERATK